MCHKSPYTGSTANIPGLCAGLQHPRLWLRRYRQPGHDEFYQITQLAPQAMESAISRDLAVLNSGDYLAFEQAFILLH